MQYREIPLPGGFEALVHTFWSLQVASPDGGDVQHHATPDGSIEIIRRMQGHSKWHRAQPQHFVAGLIDRPAVLNFSGDASFVGLRLWPWTWHALGGCLCATCINDWLPLDAARLPRHAQQEFEQLDEARTEALGLLLSPLLEMEFARIGAAVLASHTAAELSAHTGRSLRWLQRWFARFVGVPPRTYLSAPAAFSGDAARRGAERRHTDP